VTGGAIAIIIVLLTLAALHFYWGLGGRWPGHDEKSLVGLVIGKTKSGKMPDFGACALVALALALGAWLVAADRGGFRLGVSPTLVNGGYILMVLAFAVRGVLAYVPGVFDYAEGTPFHRLNQVYYSPLCLAIAGALLAASITLI
jgi:hypothetical protein